MATIRDMMPAFDLAQPASVDEAVEQLERHGSDAWVLAGGQDSFDWLKERTKRPEVLVDLGGIEELTGIRERESSLEIGAMVTLTEVSRSRAIQERFGVVSEAAAKVASPQIRNLGTLGGNLCQDVRCWYYRGGWPCYRAGGNICYAESPTALNREHCILEANRCVAVHPSDVAPALLVVDAEMVVRDRNGERTLPASRFWIGPGTDITRTTVLKPGQVLTRIRIPETMAGARFYFEKVADRAVWDFPLMNVASAVVEEEGRIARARIAVNGAAPRPLRLTEVEHMIAGEEASEELARAAGERAIRDARPLRHNDYKVALMRNLVKRAVLGEGP